MADIQKITPSLWFDGNAEEAVNFYVSVFDNSKILNVTRYQYAGCADHGMPAGTVLAMAFELEVEYCNFYSMVPAYDFSQLNLSEQGMRVEFDFRAWHELMRRINAMFRMRIDLSDLEEKSFKLTQSLTDKVEQLSAKSGHERLTRYFDRLDEEFEENSFLPYEQVWKSELGQILDDLDSDDPLEPTL